MSDQEIPRVDAATAMARLEPFLAEVHDVATRALCGKPDADPVLLVLLTSQQVGWCPRVHALEMARQGAPIRRFYASGCRLTDQGPDPAESVLQELARAPAADRFHVLVDGAFGDIAVVTLQRRGFVTRGGSA